MTSHVPHLDLVILNFKVGPRRYLIMDDPSLFQRSFSRLISLRYVCQKGGTVSKTYIFHELSLICLNNSAIALMKASSFSMLSWLSVFTLCLNKITQVHYAIRVRCMWQTFFLLNQACFGLFFYLLCKDHCMKLPSYPERTSRDNGESRSE